MEKDSIFYQVMDRLTRHYHFKDKVKPIAGYLHQKRSSGQYNAFKTRTAYTDALAKDLKTIAGDQHLNFFYTAPQVAARSAEAPQIPGGLLNEKYLNNGLTGLEILAGDIGYIRLQAFGSYEDLLPAAFTFVSNTQALIIDLRGNGGGMLSNYVSSYLLPEDSIHLNTIFWNDRTDSIYTYRTLKGPRYLGKPVYLLTDKGTFSSAEEFAYDLQALKRATIVGEATGGGANPGGLVPVYTFRDGTQLDMYISFAHVENPITKTNWEGKGVQPDVVVNPKEGLKKAHIMAVDFLKGKEQDAFIRDAYEEIKKKLATDLASTASFRN